jgi:RAD54-like protein 2
MGLGKTIQMIAFTDVFLRLTTARTVLMIVPINTLHNWLAEFNMWVPAEARTTAGGECPARSYSVYCLNETLKTVLARAQVISKLCGVVYGGVSYT